MLSFLLSFALFQIFAFDYNNIMQSQKKQEQEIKYQLPSHHQHKPQHNRTRNQQYNYSQTQQNYNSIEKFNQQLIADQKQKIAIYEIGPVSPNRLYQVASKLSAVRDQGVVTINMNLLPEYLVNFNIKRTAALFLVDMSRYLLDLALKINPITMKKYTFPDQSDIVQYFNKIPADQIDAVEDLLWRFRSDINIFQFYTKRVLNQCLMQAHNLCKMVNYEASENILSQILFSDFYVHPSEMDRKNLQMHNDYILRLKQTKIQSMFGNEKVYMQIIKQHLKALQVIADSAFKDQSYNFAILKQKDNVDIFKKSYKQTLATLHS